MASGDRTLDRRALGAREPGISVVGSGAVGVQASAAGQRFGGDRQTLGELGFEPRRQRRMRGPPDRDRCLQALRSSLGKPDRALALITFDDGDFIPVPSSWGSINPEIFTTHASEASTSRCLIDLF